VNVPLYIAEFLDANDGRFADAAQAALAIDAHAKAEFGDRLNTFLLVIDCGCEFNRRKAEAIAARTEDRYQCADWIQDYQAGVAR